MKDVVVDASCLLNLLATRREVEIVRALDWNVVSPELALAQVRYLRSPPDADGQRTNVPADLQQLRSAGLLSSRSLTDDWMDAFVECAVELDDADASCAALAATLALPLVSDDRKLRRVARQKSTAVVMVGTLEVLFQALEALGLDETASAQIAFDLRWRGNFMPRPAEAHAEWFKRLVTRHQGV